MVVMTTIIITIAMLIVSNSIDNDKMLTTVKNNNDVDRITVTTVTMTVATYTNNSSTAFSATKTHHYINIKGQYDENKNKKSTSEGVLPRPNTLSADWVAGKRVER